ARAKRRPPPGVTTCGRSLRAPKSERSERARTKVAAGGEEEASEASERVPRWPRGAKLNLALHQLLDRADAVLAERASERPPVERAEQRVGQTKGQHRRDPTPRVLEREAAIRHSVALGHALGQHVAVAGLVDLLDRRALRVG